MRTAALRRTGIANTRNIATPAPAVTVIAISRSQTFTSASEANPGGWSAASGLRAIRWSPEKQARGTLGAARRHAVPLVRDYITESAHKRPSQPSAAA